MSIFSYILDGLFEIYFILRSLGYVVVAIIFLVGRKIANYINNSTIAKYLLIRPSYDKAKFYFRSKRYKQWSALFIRRVARLVGSR